MSSEWIGGFIILFGFAYLISILYLYAEYDIDVYERDTGQTGANLLLHNLIVLAFTIPIFLVALGHMTYDLGGDFIAWLTTEA